MNDLYAFVFANYQKANHVYVHESHLLQVQQNPWASVCHLCLHFVEMVRLNPANKTDCRALSV